MMLGFEVSRIVRLPYAYLINTNKFTIALKEDQLEKYKLYKSALILRRFNPDTFYIKETYMLLIPSFTKAWLLKFKQGRPSKEFVKAIDEYNDEEVEIQPIYYDVRKINGRKYLVIFP